MLYSIWHDIYRVVKVPWNYYRIQLQDHKTRMRIYVEWIYDTVEEVKEALNNIRKKEFMKRNWDPLEIIQDDLLRNTTNES